MKKIPQISDSELEIMNIIWSNGGSALFAEIMTALNNEDRKQNTVLTFLSRLVDKKIVSVKKHGRLNEYIAMITKDDYINEQTKTFINKVYAGNVKNLVSSLLKQDYINSEDIKELEEFWNEGEAIDE